MSTTNGGRFSSPLYLGKGHPQLSPRQAKQPCLVRTEHPVRLHLIFGNGTQDLIYADLASTSGSNSRVGFPEFTQAVTRSIFRI